MYSYRQYMDSNLCTVTGSIWTLTNNSYRQYMDSTLCTVTGSVLTVHYLQLLAVYGQ